MTTPETSVWSIAADAVLLLHVAVVIFIVGGLLATLIGGWRHWQWVRGPGFRMLHLLAIAVVAVQSWFAYECPLTTLEQWLRWKAGLGALHEQGFIAHWLQELLFYSAPNWVFVCVYTGFGALVLASWWWVRPSFASKPENSRALATQP